MTHDATTRYAEHLTESDLAMLGSAVDLPPERAAAEFRAHPALVEAALAAPAAYERVFHAGDDTLLRASPFLVFAVAVHRALLELRGTNFVEERVGGSMRVPVFDVTSLRDYGNDAERRFFTIELLASYTKVASGPIGARQGRRWRRQRFSELDPARMAAAVVAVPDGERAGLYRRLGDLALFLTGVFPDFTARRTVQPLERERLLRSVSQLGPTVADITELAGNADQVLGWLGPRWYELAAERTPLPTFGQQLRDVAARFDYARRFLNVVTDRVLFAARSRFFPTPST